MVYASRFALIVRDGGRIVSRTRVSAPDMADALARLPDDLAAAGEAQWANLRRAHPPLHCGARTIRLDQPQVMGILNVTPDSFSDGGEFLDNPEVASAHAAAMLEGGRGDDRRRRRIHPARRGGGVGRRRAQARRPGDRAARGGGRGGQHRHPPRQR